MWLAPGARWPGLGRRLAPALIAKYGQKFESIPAPFSQTVYANIDIAFPNCLRTAHKVNPPRKQSDQFRQEQRTRF